jgi:hypothetical protein
MFRSILIGCAETTAVFMPLASDLLKYRTFQPGLRQLDKFADI